VGAACFYARYRRRRRRENNARHRPGGGGGGEADKRSQCRRCRCRCRCRDSERKRKGLVVRRPLRSRGGEECAEPYGDRHERGELSPGGREARFGGSHPRLATTRVRVSSSELELKTANPSHAKACWNSTRWILRRRRKEKCKGVPEGTAAGGACFCHSVRGVSLPRPDGSLGCSPMLSRDTTNRREGDLK
jgi:hypothetical protein